MVEARGARGSGTSKSSVMDREGDGMNNQGRGSGEPTGAGMG